MVITKSGRRRMLTCVSAAVAVLLYLAGVAALAVPPSSSLAVQSSSNASKKDYGLIYGTVWGADNRPVAGVPITIRRTSDKKPKWQVVSDQQGEFAQRVPAGTQDYVVQADIKMPKGQLKPETTVHIDNDERRNISLHLIMQEVRQR